MPIKIGWGLDYAHCIGLSPSNFMTFRRPCTSMVGSSAWNQAEVYLNNENVDYLCMQISQKNPWTTAVVKWEINSKDYNFLLQDWFGINQLNFVCLQMLILTIKLFRFLLRAEIGLVSEIDDLFSTSDRVIMLEVLIQSIIVLPRKE